MQALSFKSSTCCDSINEVISRYFHEHFRSLEQRALNAVARNFDNLLIWSYRIRRWYLLPMMFINGGRWCSASFRFYPVPLRNVFMQHISFLYVHQRYVYSKIHTLPFISPWKVNKTIHKFKTFRRIPSVSCIIFVCHDSFSRSFFQMLFIVILHYSSIIVGAR